MKFTIQNKIKSLAKIDATLVFAHVKNGKPDFAEFFSRLSKEAQKNISKADIKAGSAKVFRFSSKPNLIYVSVEKKWSIKKATLAIRRFTTTAKKDGAKTIAIYLDDLEKDEIGAEDLAVLAVKNTALAHYDFSKEFKKKPKTGWPNVSELVLITHHAASKIRQVAKEAEVIAQYTNECRTLCNYPPSHMTPQALAEAALTAAKGIDNLKVGVFDEKKLKNRGMNAILAVGSGSANPPRLIIMDYQGAKPKDKTLAIVGKGITFDSGGLNTKPSDYMGDMHMDMSGGAATIYALAAIAKLKLPVNVTGFIPAAENMPGGKSYRMQDIIKAYDGKTIEIGHTDAEGRVVMADAIGYAKTKKPALLVTIATLTGASVVALGQRWSGLFVKNNPRLQNALEKIGADSGDLVWPLPLTEDNEAEVKGNFADVTNTTKNGSRYGGASSAAGFLSNFAQKQKFAHIDMAPRMTTMPEEEALPKGAVGFGVAYFVELAKQWQELQDAL